MKKFLIENKLNKIPKQEYILNVLILAGIFILVRFMLSRSNYFWDLDVYQKAVNIFNNGHNPYIDLKELRFVYSPYVLFVFSLAGKYLSSVLTCFYLLSTAYFIVNKVGREILIYALASMVIFANKDLGISFVTGNLTLFVHFLLIAIFFSEFRFRTSIFVMLLCLVSIIKPYYLSYGFLLFIDSKSVSNSLRNFIFICLIVFSIYVSQYLLFPSMFNDFLVSLQAQVLGSSSGPGRDVGFAPYYVFTTIFHNRNIALILHFLFIGLIFFFCYFSLDRIRVVVSEVDSSKLWLYWMLIMIVMLNPRMKEYDYWLVTASAMSIIFTLFRSIRIPYVILSLIGMLLSVKLAKVLLGMNRDVVAIYFSIIFAGLLQVFVAGGFSSIRKIIPLMKNSAS